ncbi:Uncharacterized protein SCF082_LOCUS17151 [Durusdinium trenchii]|uniref:Uncharacterized protein n=1 Tax=Durusdinium trenchii TaxID=1381693 RepID=A0ABP0KFI7_9DINO
MASVIDVVWMKEEESDFAWWRSQDLGQLQTTTGGFFELLEISGHWGLTQVKSHTQKSAQVAELDEGTQGLGSGHAANCPDMAGKIRGTVPSDYETPYQVRREFHSYGVSPRLNKLLKA